MAAPFEPPRTPMEAKVREVIPSGAYAYEPKWDGFRCLAWADERRLDSRSAKPLLRYFPELEEALEQLPGGTVVDGEVVVVSDGKLDFDALSQRLHPAESRITKLSVETPAQLVAFDLLADQGEDLRDLPFAERRERLVALADGLSHPWHLTLSTTDRAEGERWFTDFESAGCDGIVCKALGAPYVEGKREMLKIKHRRTVDCVVGGYRLHKEGDRVGSLLLGLHDDDGALHFIGHCSGFGDADRVSLLVQLRELEAPDAFGAGVRRPGEPSRWTGDKDLSWVPLLPGLVCEVSYDQLTGGRFRHATRFHRWRPDKDPQACTFDQLERPEGPTFEDIVAR
jgi:ATP-dependent DNA ligase